jgi:starch synthase
VLEFIGLGYDGFFAGGPFEFYGMVNYMKLGIIFSDQVVTVSPTYAKEIRTPEYGYRLEGLLEYFSPKLTGIYKWC